jgi:3-hydroxy-9,10-secoandrosta-1,3,5(10)-triene-9,17-dione monooxygenase reductase component
VLVCFVRSSRTAAAVRARGAFVVNLLEQGQASVSHRFARPADDHFAGARIRLDELGLPILLGGLGHLACTVPAIHDGGDHDIVIGRVRHAAMAPGSPLVFFRGGYGRLAEDVFEPERCWYA